MALRKPVRHQQPSEAPSLTGGVFASVTPMSNADRYAAWVQRLGRLPLPVTPPVFPWQAAHPGPPALEGCAVLPFPNQNVRVIPTRKEIS